MSIPRLQLEGLHPPLLRPVDLSLEAGETLALSGPSGAGKSLLLRAIADLDLNEGEAWLDGVPRRQFRARDWRRSVMLVPAESHWWADTVRPHSEHWDEQALAALAFGPEVLDWEVHRLSSGERQRLALVRALSLEPPVLLLDEVSANLDTTNTRLLEALLNGYQARHQAAILWVSHDDEQRERIAGRQALVNDGRLLELEP
jgi:ABC-type iron transport system FetAB ATPase subunit